MPSHKQSVSFSKQAFDYAQSLVDSGEYPTISAAVSGELVRMSQRRADTQRLFEAEVTRRMEAPADGWTPKPSEESRTVPGTADDRNAMEAEILSRLNLPDDRWIRCDTVDDVMAPIRTKLEELRRKYEASG